LNVPALGPLTRLSRLRGLLLGGAVGDALGAPVEFMRREEIISRFGPRGITSFAPAYGRLGAITDDTQMTLFTLEGLIRAEVRWSARGICNPVAVIDRAYRRWYATQTQSMIKTQELDGWLLDVPELWSRRAPGVTCLAALAEKDIGEPAINDSKGAGGIMRVGPIGLVNASRPYELARDAAGLTHGHKTGSVAAGWFAVWIRGLAEGLAPEPAAQVACAQCRGDAPELDAALVQAFALVTRPAAQVPAALGEGWVAEEAAAIALWCVLTAPSPWDAICLAVNIDGDSDTTGTLVGQALGAWRGSSWIPPAMLDQLELRDVIEMLAADADHISRGGIDSESEAFDAIWARYPGW
jgi:ADP-ribosyl-[dinitrogen reductase] hydrolase